MTDISTAKDLLDVGELSGVRVHAFSAERVAGATAPNDSEEAEQSIQVQIGQNPGLVEVRVQLELKTAAANYRAEAASQYRFPSEYEVSERVAREFAEAVGVMAVYPYLRELVQSSSARLSLPPVTLPLLRQGAINLTPDNEP
ncbi:hypothetical protein JG550_000849 [Curtobacterium flaccumfaciens pv. flaccumfaciens]|uniref:hypothetical protein n=1 Tax=Curtobacterium flaccumfaciens TaxID=2035 RepID=UPI0014321488|nr:hypothetical protein [Curtobacterium flaccumfaciens]MBO9046716.1 hypothetical protein [Curtobacterium flaccumfaciens pv. flaccumfaciens]QTR91590.1 hypothetical protein JG550_000849 [Curtobacterium flaccumfaciens pv. flaccumfaciens]